MLGLGRGGGGRWAVSQKHTLIRSFFIFSGKMSSSCRGGQGAGGVREAGGERAGSGIPKSGGKPRERDKISRYWVTFHNRNTTKRREPLRKGTGSGSKSYGRREFQTQLSCWARIVHVLFTKWMKLAIDIIIKKFWRKRRTWFPDCFINSSFSSLNA